MANILKLETSGKGVPASLQEFCRSILETDEISAILAPIKLPMKNMVMPTLVSEPDRLAGIDLLSPAFPMNTAKVVSKLTRKPIGAKVAAIMRPCEIRAFVELLKLNQGKRDDLIIIGMDCLGAYNNTGYIQFVAENPEDTAEKFFKTARTGKFASVNGIELTNACKACERPVPANADIQIGIYGVDTDEYLLVESCTTAGDEITALIGLPKVKMPEARQEAIDSLVKDRDEFRGKMFAETQAATSSLEKLTTYLANCVNCYNCRVACPVCYCKECVFVTDVFNHEPSQYLNWAVRKGAIKMPTDTVFYHMTRLAHMSTACVGCGQCSNACPNDIPVMELFRLVADRTQKGFNYEAGCDPEAKPPLSEFRENEYSEVVGIT